MVRPKASQEKLQFALLFADAISTNSIKEGGDCRFLVDRKGDASIFSLLSSCLPNLVDIQYRDAVTQVQLNKHLVKCGYIPFRQRNRIKGTTDQWDRGVSRWKNRRWVDPNDKHDLSHLQMRLQDLRKLIYPETIATETVIKHLKGIHRLNSNNTPMCRIPKLVCSSRLLRRLQLGELSMKPCPAFKLMRSELAILATSFYQVLQLLTL